jgi:SAM-dependent methyltransferase
MLEIGCSRGYLTSFFILAGHDVRGVDLSSEAIAAAKASFGERFFLAESGMMEADQPYDVIYHVGTIGCVEDPAGYTRRMLAMLKPGGLLLFNAPNVDACWYPGQLWLNHAPPPDVTVLYKMGFWKREFGELASVRETVELCDPGFACAVAVRKGLGLRWRKPKPTSLFATADDTEGLRFWPRAARKADRVFQRVTKSLGLATLAPSQPTEFGLFVRMEKH